MSRQKRRHHVGHAFGPVSPGCTRNPWQLDVQAWRAGSRKNQQTADAALYPSMFLLSNSGPDGDQIKKDVTARLHHPMTRH
jgi:hypothetical protein